jgi:glycine/D-amino acid oxidase-like deaminating enzyme
MRTFDLVVVGAGIGSSSLVYNLLKQGFTGSILVIEKLDGVAQGPTSFSAGGFRNLWTTPINQQLCSKGMELLKGYKDEIGSSCGFKQTGYLFTYYADAWGRIPDAAKIWADNGVNFELWTPKHIEDKIPGPLCGIDHIDAEVAELLGFQPIVGGVFGGDCGAFDPSQAASGYFKKSATFANAPVVQLRTEVIKVLFGANGKAEGVVIKDASGTEETVNAGIVALCTGPWTNQLLERSGVPQDHRMPIISQKRMMFITDFPNQDPRWMEIPMTIIDQGIYFKEESGNLMIGKAKEDSPHTLEAEFEPDYYVEEINLPMQERIPSTSVCKLKNGWASFYDTVTADHNAILGWHPEYSNLLLQFGYSGHGAMESPAAGICLAELIITGKYQTIDCTPLRWSRFRENQLVQEKIVI